MNYVDEHTLRKSITNEQRETKSFLLNQRSFVAGFTGQTLQRETVHGSGTVNLKYQYLGNCAPTPPLTQQVITS